VVLAVRDDGKWEFNPPMEHILYPENIIVAMTSPHGRIELEEALAELSAG